MTTRINLWNRGSSTPQSDSAPAVTPPNRVEAGEWERSVEPDYGDEDEPVPANPKGHLGSMVYPRGNRVPKPHIRSGSVSICVSAEEEAILRDHAMKLDTSFSDWARKVLFRALGRKPPRRRLPE
jgi:hypothetical protein